MEMPKKIFDLVEQAMLERPSFITSGPINDIIPNSCIMLKVGYTEISAYSVDDDGKFYAFEFENYKPIHLSIHRNEIFSLSGLSRKLEENSLAMAWATNLEFPKSQSNGFNICEHVGNANLYILNKIPSSPIIRQR